MKPASHHIRAISGGLAGVLAMAAIGWNLGGGFLETTEEDHSQGPSVTRSSRSRQVPRNSGLNPEDARRLAVIRNAPNPTERMRATIALANSLPLFEIEAWLGGGKFNIREGADLMLFTGLLRERWLREDPESFALWCMKHRSRGASEILSRLAETQPQRVLAFFKLHPDNRAELRAMAAMAGEHPDLAIQRLREMDAAGLQNIEFYQVDGLFQALAGNSPAAFEELSNSLKQPLKGYAEKALIVTKMKTDFSGELRKLCDRPNGFKEFESLYRYLDGGRGKLFDELANLPPSWRASIAGMSNYYIDKTNAQKWWNADLTGLGFTAGEQLRLRTTTLQKMATNHPEAALELMAEFEFPPQEGDADGSDRRWTIIANAISGSPEKTAEIIAGLTSAKDRENAGIILERRKVRAQEKSAGEIKTPEQWLEKAATIDSDARYSFGSKLRNFPQTALTRLEEQFQSMPDDEKQQIAPVLASGISSSDFNPEVAGEALRYLLANPSAGTPDSDPAKSPWLYPALNYALNLAVHDPEAGVEWVTSLPDGQAKLWARINLHSIWKNYDPAAADRWLESLPAETRNQVEEPGKKPR